MDEMKTSAGGGALIPQERRERNPLITPEGFAMLNRIAQHPDAPIWNYLVGDRIEHEDLAYVEEYRDSLKSGRASHHGAPPRHIIDRLTGLRDRVILFRERLIEGMDVEKDWASIEPMTREDIAVRPETIVPIGSDLSRMVVYDTSGTTGHALTVPYHPGALAANHALVEFALSRYGVFPDFGPHMVSCMCVSARAITVTFPMVFSVWNQAGFAKVNLRLKEWASVDHARRFFDKLSPHFLTGDPVGFAEMLGWEIPARPKAIVSTAVALSPALKNKLQERYGCPVIDWYSTTETGPVAYSCPKGKGLHILSPDVYVEIIDEDGKPLPKGKAGEIAVTGGHNPYMPLLRYRTGDRGAMDFAKCECSDPSPRIVNFEGREVILFRAADGSVVNPVDIGRTIRELPFVQHEFIQRADGSCDLNIRPIPGWPPQIEQIDERLRALFGREIKLRINLDENLGDDSPSGKVKPYRTELKPAD